MSDVQDPLQEVFLGEHRIDKQSARAAGTYYPVASTEIALHGDYHEMPGLKRKLS